MECVRQWAFVASGEADESRGVFGEIVGVGDGVLLFAVAGAQFDFRDEAAEVLISLLGFG